MKVKHAQVLVSMLREGHQKLDGLASQIDTQISEGVEVAQLMQELDKHEVAFNDARCLCKGYVSCCFERCA